MFEGQRTVYSRADPERFLCLEIKAPCLRLLAVCRRPWPSEGGSESPYDSLTDSAFFFFSRRMPFFFPSFVASI